MLKTIFTFFILLISLSPYVFCQTKNLDVFDKNISSVTLFSAETLLDKIYAVHATHSLPNSTYLRAGFDLERFSSLEKAMMPKARQTLHFALGELVRPVEGVINWEDCPYAVVTPLRTLQPQLININCYDTFILGDLKLSSEIYLVVPENVAEEIESPATIVSYDPNTQTLREAVDALILHKEGWHIEMNGEDIEDELHEAYLDGCNINVAEFFSPLKEKIPCLAVGLRFHPLDGEHYRLSLIETNLVVMAQQMLANTFRETGDDSYLESSSLENSFNMLNEQFTIWSYSLTDFNWCSESLTAYRQLKAELEKWDHLTKIELLLRAFYQKTLMSAPSDFFLKCSVLLEQPNELENFIIQNKELLLDYPQKSTYN